MTKTERLQVRITPDLKEDLKKLAAAEGSTMSDYINNLIFHAVAEEIRMYSKIEAEVNEKCPDLDEAEKAFVIHEQMMTRKAVRNRMDRLQHMKREMKEKNPTSYACYMRVATKEQLEREG